MESATDTTGTTIGIGTSAGQQQWNCAVGNEVLGCDEHKIGKVTEVHPGYLTVTRGLITHTTLYVPTTMPVPVVLLVALSMAAHLLPDAAASVESGPDDPANVAADAVPR